LRIAKAAGHAAPAPVAAPAPTSQAPVDDGRVQLCLKHKNEPVVDACVVCGKPLCTKCMEQFGHVCSVFCRQQAEQKRIYIPVYANQKSVVAHASETRSRSIVYAVVGAVAAVLGLWFYYAWFAREPKIVMRISLGSPSESIEQREDRPAQYFKLIGPGELLTVSGGEASLLNVADHKTLWTTPLSGETVSKIKRLRKSFTVASADDLADFYEPQIITTSNDLWINLHDRVVRLDRKTGSLKENPFPGKVNSFSEQGDTLLAVYTETNGQHTLARVSLPDGNIQTLPLPSADDTVKTQIAKKPIKDKTSGGTTAEEKVAQVHSSRILAAVDKHNAEVDAAMADPDADISPDDPFGYGEFSRFTSSGPTVVRFDEKLLEHKTVTHEAMKAKGKSVLDGNVTASQGMELAQEMMNDSRRAMTGGVDVEDVSRYQVTLHRLFADNVADWTGEVSGPPRFYALKTLDLVVAGQSVTALDRSNKKLWEGKLSYPLGFLGDQPPILETKDAVYVADPGVLTCFDLATGSARWRLNSVGISALHIDQSGKIYVNSTTAGPDKIKYSQQVNVHEHIHPIIMKVDPASGKVLWQIESYGDKCMMSGKFLYSTWVTSTQSALKLEEGPDTHYNLYLLKPGSGGAIWNFHVDNQHVMQTEVQQNWILLRFADNVYVLKFFSL